MLDTLVDMKSLHSIVNKNKEGGDHVPFTRVLRIRQTMPLAPSFKEVEVISKKVQKMSSVHILSVLAVIRSVRKISREN